METDQRYCHASVDNKKTVQLRCRHHNDTNLHTIRIWQQSVDSMQTLTIFWLCKCEWDDAPVTSNKICQALPVFPVIINNRELSHPYSWLREGYVSFWNLDMVLASTDTVTRQAFECNRHFPTAIRNELKHQHKDIQTGVCFCLFVAYLTSQQHESVSQGRICSDKFTCCHTEIEVADQTFHLTQPQYTDTGPTSPGSDPITPGAWQGSHRSASF